MNASGPGSSSSIDGNVTGESVALDRFALENLSGPPPTCFSATISEVLNLAVRRDLLEKLGLQVSNERFGLFEPRAKLCE
jgi:hypothetical protein